ncbi:MAG: hypothetical protein AAFR14_01990 [Bacteroidota bacterium]
MTDPKVTESTSSLIPILSILWGHRYRLLILGISTAVLTSVIMLLQDNYYRSTTTFYPVNSKLLEPVINVERGGGYYGDDFDVDRLLTIGHSRELAEAMIKKHELTTHYDINKQGIKGLSQTLKTYRKLIKIYKTEYDAITIAVEDKDPVMAQRLATSVREGLNLRALEVSTAAKSTMEASLQASIMAKQHQIRSITDTLSMLRSRYGIYDTEAQAEAIATREMTNANSTSLLQTIQNYNSGIAKVMELEVQQEVLSRGLAYSEDRLNDVRAALEQQNGTLHIIEEAALPLEKSRPRRSLYVIAVTLFMVGVGSLGLLASSVMSDSL